VEVRAADDAKGAAVGLLPVIIFCVLAPIFAWRFGLSVNAPVLLGPAVSGLIVTALAIALPLLLVFMVRTAPPNPQPDKLGGFVCLFVLLISLVIEALGAMATLLVCLIGLRQTIRGHAGWFAALRVGSLAPLAWSSLMIVLGFNAIPFGQTCPSTVGIIPSLLFSGMATPMVAAIVTTAYAIWAVCATIRGQIAPPLYAT
jgi:hypothetical protein